MSIGPALRWDGCRSVVNPCLHHCVLLNGSVLSLNRCARCSESKYEEAAAGSRKELVSLRTKRPVFSAIVHSHTLKHPLRSQSVPKSRRRGHTSARVHSRITQQTLRKQRNNCCCLAHPRAAAMAAAAVDKRPQHDVEMSSAPEPAEAMQLEDRPADEEADEDLYSRLKTLQRQYEFLDIQVSCRHCLEASDAYGLDPAQMLCARKKWTQRYYSAQQPTLSLSLTTGGVHQGGAEKPEAGAAASARGGQTDTGGAAGDWPVPGNGGPGALPRKKRLSTCRLIFLLPGPLATRTLALCWASGTPVIQSQAAERSRRFATR